jgi:hypothetical protein
MLFLSCRPETLNNNAFLSATLSTSTVLVISAAILLTTPDQALAYIEPGAGSSEGLGERQLNDKLHHSLWVSRVQGTCAAYRAAVGLDNSLGNGKSKARAILFFRGVKFVKDEI